MIRRHQVWSVQKSQHALSRRVIRPVFIEPARAHDLIKVPTDESLHRITDDHNVHPVRVRREDVVDIIEGQLPEVYGLRMMPVYFLLVDNPCEIGPC